MREAIEAVMDLQPVWVAEWTDAMRRRGELVRGVIPAWLRERTAALAAATGVPEDDLVVQGRDNTGRMAQIPWVRFASRSHSPSATDGWYAVYLFSADGGRAYLSIIQGTQIWTGVEYNDRSAEQIASRGAWARVCLERRADLSGWSMEMDLAGTTGKGAAYERGSAVCRVYERASVPDAATLAADAVDAARLLRVLYEEEGRGWVPGDGSPEVRMASEAASVAAGRPRRSTAGFRLDADERGLIERHAVARATAHYEALGGEVKDVGARRPYDLEVALDGATLSVEVKGTVTDGQAIVLTRGEVEHHAGAHPANALVVVSGITLDRSTDPPSVSGGHLAETRPWTIEPDALEVISYSYRRP